MLEWYRLRWQVELVFKRFKSLAQLGHVPKYDDDSAKAWLYGKLFVALLVEKLIHHARAISPGLRRVGAGAPAARGVTSNGLWAPALADLRIQHDAERASTARALPQRPVGIRCAVR